MSYRSVVINYRDMRECSMWGDRKNCVTMILWNGRCKVLDPSSARLSVGTPHVAARIVERKIKTQLQLRVNIHDLNCCGEISSDLFNRRGKSRRVLI